MVVTSCSWMFACECANVQCYIYSQRGGPFLMHTQNVFFHKIDKKDVFSSFPFYFSLLFFCFCFCSLLFSFPLFLLFSLSLFLCFSFSLFCSLFLVLPSSSFFVLRSSFFVLRSSFSVLLCFFLFSISSFLECSKSDCLGLNCCTISCNISFFKKNVLGRLGRYSVEAIFLFFFDLLIFPSLFCVCVLSFFHVFFSCVSFHFSCFFVLLAFLFIFVFL